MLVASLPLIVCLAGLLIFAFAKEKVGRIGEHMFWTGLLVTLMSVMGKTSHLF
jgi:hypothetical protein